ncbi:MAG: flagellar hook-basal body complex protein [Clostridium sp.]|nr:flagellar hook-basal body complex protein [Clostridium sp.]
MIRSIYSAVSGMLVQQNKENVISNNIANINTYGFKQDNLEAKTFRDVLMANNEGKNVLGEMSIGSAIDGTTTEFTQGNITTTNLSTDFAINGRGFFTVKNPSDNQNYYTRDGHFHVNSQGYLADENGDYVMGKNLSTGAEEPINVGSGQISSDGYGNLNINGSPAYSMNLVDFNDYNSLKKVGNNLYSGANPIQNANVTVQEGSLEGSNVSSTDEAVDMMSTMRNFEANQKVVQSADQTIQEAIKVGTVGQ